jgi:hypothetical protein
MDNMLKNGMQIFHDFQRVSHKGNKEYKGNDDMISHSLLPLYSLFPLCETSPTSSIFKYAPAAFPLTIHQSRAKRSTQLHYICFQQFVDNYFIKN